MPRVPRKDGTGYRSSKEEDFAEAWRVHGFAGSDIQHDYTFHPERGWMFDFAWPSLKVAVEINGFSSHGNIKSMIRDAEKTREAIRMGWKVLPFTSSCIGSKAKLADAVEYVCDILSMVHQQEA